MSKIRVRNFGPITQGYLENNGWLEISKVTLFIGNQGSGKSTMAKLISMFSWLEKVLTRGDIEAKEVTIQMFLSFLKYHRIHNYWDQYKSEIEYSGSSFYIGYKAKQQYVSIIKQYGANYVSSRVMYVPAERSFLGVVNGAFSLKGMPESLFAFAEEYRKAQGRIKNQLISLPLGNSKYQYDDESDISYVVGSDYKVNLLEASSGFQSTIPLFVTISNLVNSLSEDLQINYNINVDNAIRMNKEISLVYSDTTLSAEEKVSQISKIAEKYSSKCLISIVEEPELNLFPSSQMKLLFSLLALNNKHNPSKLILTTHSPYLINYLSIVIQAAYLRNEIEKRGNQEIKKELFSIVKEDSLVESQEVSIFECNEKTGEIRLLPNSHGIPSDKNYLNRMLREGNEIFDSLLELEDRI
jgi:predicted ATPase